MNKNIYDNLNLLPEDLQGWNGNSKVFHELIQKIQPKTIIEVGTWKGQSAINMALEIKRLGINSKIYCVDTWLGSLTSLINPNNLKTKVPQKNGCPQIYYQFLSNVIHNNVQDVILPIPNTSTNAAKYLKHKNITSDLIYIDASHEYEDVTSDLYNYYKLLNKNGTIFGDDYDWPQVKKAVENFCSKNKLIFETKESKFWLIHK